MAWTPTDDKSARLLHQIVSRERDNAFTTFDHDRQRIEREQAAKGVFGGPVLVRCTAAAEALIRDFANRTVPELLDVVQALAQGKPEEAVEWVRTTMTSEIDSLVNGLAGRIDELKTAGRVQGASGRLQPVKAQALRDVEIALGKATLGIPLSSQQLSPVSVSPVGMYNLLVAAHEHAWDGRPFTLDETSRVLREFTDPDLTTRFADLGAEAVAELIELPTLFACERWLKTAPRFGRLTRVRRRETDVRIDYEVIPLDPFLTWVQFEKMGQQLGIAHDFEFSRQHWSVKEVDLNKVLALNGIVLPKLTAREILEYEGTGTDDRKASVTSRTEEEPSLRRTETIPAGNKSGVPLQDHLPLILGKGQRLQDRYVIENEIGEGGMARVYKAVDQRLSVLVALKVLTPTLDDEARNERFRREVTTARRITHPNVCRVYDYHEDRGTVFCSMEYVEGESLRELLERERGPVEPRRVADIVRQIAAGLTAMHGQAIIHRDLKPAIESRII